MRFIGFGKFPRQSSSHDSRFNCLSSNPTSLDLLVHKSRIVSPLYCYSSYVVQSNCTLPSRSWCNLATLRCKQIHVNLLITKLMMSPLPTNWLSDYGIVPLRVNKITRDANVHFCTRCGSRNAVTAWWLIVSSCRDFIITFMINQFSSSQNSFSIRNNLKYFESSTCRIEKRKKILSNRFFAGF